MHNLTLRTHHIRDLFKTLLIEKQFTSVNREGSMTALTGNTTIEIVNASFIADENAIFGEVNWDYVKREEEWYESQSLNVNDFPGGPPQIWKAVADKDGFINSNYGAIIFSSWNGNQYDRTLEELKKNPESRRAIMIYTRPEMWTDYNKNGRSDFLCTNAVQYLIRNGKLHAIVQMRSNDSIFGFRNDRAWQQHVLEKLANDLNIPVGNLYWNAGSLHVYARHYYLVDHFAKTGELNISKADYERLYPDSPYLLR
jgi:thymidylate synthase